MRHKVLHATLIVLLTSGALVLTLALCGAFAQAPLGNTLYVAPDGHCGEMTPCYNHPQDAVDAASDGDTVKVAAGLYTGVSERPRPPGYYGLDDTQLLYITKTVTLRGGYTVTNWTTSDPVANPTTLDAQGEGRVLVVSGYTSSTIENLHITNGTGDEGCGVFLWESNATLIGNTVVSNFSILCGGGVYIQYGSPSLSQNVLVGNHANGEGGGLYLTSSNATIKDNAVISNTAQDRGGGIALVPTNTVLAGNTIISNVAGDRGGGGVSAGYGYNAVLDSNIVANNRSQGPGGGMGFYDTNATLVDNIIAGNDAGDMSGGLHLHGANLRLAHNTIANNTGVGLYLKRLFIPGEGNGELDYIRDSTASMTNTIVASHTVGIQVSGSNTATLKATLWYGNQQDMVGNTLVVSPSIHGDPAFVRPTTFDYHITPDSVAINAGVDAGIATDIDSDRRPIGAGFDIGADEYLATVYLPGIFRYP